LHRSIKSGLGRPTAFFTTWKYQSRASEMAEEITSVMKQAKIKLYQELELSIIFKAIELA
jgi:hypothetical protein